MHRRDVLDDPLVGVRRRVRRAVGAAVAAPVERDDAVGPAQVVDLRLPLARVDDRADGRSTSVRSPDPKTSYASRTPSAAVANPDASGRRATPDSSRVGPIGRCGFDHVPVPRRRDEVADQQVHLHRIATERRVAGAVEHHQPCPEELGESPSDLAGC